MQCNQNSSVSRCHIHSFSLKTLHRDKRNLLNASTFMCRAKVIKNKRNRAHCKNYQGAMFNRDRCHATPAFILPSQKKEYLQSTREFLRDHQNKIRQYELQPNQMYIAKPRSRSMYCNVCREAYQQYVDHIKSIQHRNNVKNSTFNDYILELEEDFKLKNTKELSIHSTEITDRFTNEEESALSRALGTKKIKINQQNTNNLYTPPKMQNVLMNNLMFSLPQLSPYLQNLRNYDPYQCFFNTDRPEYAWISLDNQMQPMINQNFPMLWIPFQMPLNTQYHAFQQF